MQSVRIHPGWNDNGRRGPLIYRRLAKGSLCLWAAPIGLIGGALIGVAVAIALKSPSWVNFWIIGMGLGYFVGLKAYEHCIFQALLTGLVARGAPKRLEFLVEAGEGGLSWRSDRVAVTVQWPAVTEVSRIGPDWMFLCDNVGLFVPETSFESADAERAFLAEAVSRMSDAARARSRMAVSLAESRA